MLFRKEEARQRWEAQKKQGGRSVCLCFSITFSVSASLSLCLHIDRVSFCVSIHIQQKIEGGFHKLGDALALALAESSTKVP